MIKLKSSWLRQHSSLIIRLGLAAVFLANAYAAWFAPDEFRDILSHSVLNTIWPSGVNLFVQFIGVSDGLVSLALLVGIKLRWVAAYAAAWLLGVMIVTRPVDFSSILEHVGFLSMAIYLWATD